MWNHSLRSAVVLVLLLGTLALAVPYVSGFVDHWLFSDSSQPAPSKWKEKPVGAKKASSRGKPALETTGRQSSYADDSEPSDKPPFEFDFQEEPRPAGQPTVKLSEHVEPSGPAADPLAVLQEQIEDLGATHLTVEVEGDRYECRSLFPLSPESSYQKAFSAFGTTPQAAMEQVLAEARNWKKRAAARR